MTSSTRTDVNPDYDPFAESVPALSFTDVPEGTSYDMRVTEYPREVQSFDPKTKRPAVWPESGNPKMAVVVEGIVDGEEKALWCTKPSALFVAIKDAAKIGGRIVPGTVLRVTFTHEIPAKSRGLSAAKQYTAEIIS